MKTTRHLCRILTVLAVMAGLRCLVAQSGNGLLLPFPSETGTAETVSPASAVPNREAGAPGEAADDTRRALELADTFLRRQQSEIANSVPRRGLTPVRVPARTVAPAGRVIARSAAAPPLILAAPQVEEPPLDPLVGPSSELLPLPGENASGVPDASVLPDAAAMLPPGQVMQTEGDTAPLPVEGALPDNVVSRDELAPAPAYGSIETQERRGPVFRVGGAEAMNVARSRGYKFTPAGGIGPRDGNHTAAAQFPNVLTSEVHGARMSQLRPPSAWKMEETSNTFFMFCDAAYNAVRLAPGWRIRGIRLEGPSWRWVACPRTGANTASFSVRIHAYKGQETATSVQLAGITLEGPEGATDWEDAFPDLGKQGLATSRAGDTPPDRAAAKSSAAEPPLPQ
jgi:hypothetical protein